MTAGIGGIGCQRQQINTSQYYKNQKNNSYCKDGRQHVHQFERFRVFLIKVYTGYSGIVNLLEEFSHIRSALVPNPCSGEQTTGISSIENTYAEIYISTKTHVVKSSQSLIDVGTDSHIEATGIKLVHLLFSAANSTGSEE